MCCGGLVLAIAVHGPAAAAGAAGPSVPARPGERAIGRGTYAPGAGLRVRTEDGKFALGVSLWAQLLATVRHDDAPPGGVAPTTFTFEVRRARLVFTGNVVSPNLKYNVHLMFSPKDLGFRDGTPHTAPIFLLTALYDRFRHAHVQVGYQFVPYAGQRSNPPPRLPMIDFSSANTEFTLERDVGVQVFSPDVGGLRRLRTFAGVFVGDGLDVADAAGTGLTYVGRVDVLPLGMIDDARPAGAGPAPLRILLGGAYAFDDRNRRSRALGGLGFADGGTTSSHNMTVDLLVKWSGLSLLADLSYRRGWRQVGPLGEAGAPVEAARSGFGWTAQMGLLVPRTRLEFMARWSGVRPPRALATALARLDEAGAGFNYYFLEHAFKLQVDYNHQRGPALPAGRADLGRVMLQLMF